MAAWSPGERSAKLAWRNGGTVGRRRKVLLHHGLRLRPFRQPCRHVAERSAPPGRGRPRQPNVAGWRRTFSPRLLQEPQGLTAKSAPPTIPSGGGALRWALPRGPAAPTDGPFP